MTTLREKRFADVSNRLVRTEAQRNGCLVNLVRYELRIKALRRQVQRLEKAIADVSKPDVLPPVKVAQVPPGIVAEYEASEPAIPPFLQRKADDKAAADAIRKEQADRKTQKARGRIEKMKAKQRGDTKRMPLSGKDALAAIRAAD